jgi:hypothetical protein
MSVLLAGSLLALVLGLRHAAEPDHLAAVSTLVATDGGSDRRRGALVALLWGLGHTAAILGVGVVLHLLRREVPSRLDEGFELLVAVTLLWLGVRSLRRSIALGRRGPARLHAHGGAAHVHPGPADHVHLGRMTLARRPLVIGLIHGLAGSGGIAALAMASMPSFASGLCFVVWFGLGATSGMVLLSGLLGLALRKTAASARGAALALGAAGALSLGLGLAKGLPLVYRLLG